MSDKTEVYRSRAKEPDGKGTRRSEGSNKRLLYLANVRECRMHGGKGCKKKR